MKYRNFFSYYVTVLFLWLVYFFTYLFDFSNQSLIFFSIIIYLIFFYRLYIIISKKIYFEALYLNYIILIFLFIFFIFIIFNSNYFYLFIKNYIFEKTFWYWDAIQVWNKAAINSFFNDIKEYQIYPILYPSQWSIIYKFQDNKDIWFIAKLSLFFLPIIFLIQSYSILFNKKYNFSEKLYFLIFFIFIVLYFSNPSQFQHIFSGYMDSILAFYFILGLFFCKAYEINKKSYFLYVAILIAALSTLIKQTGFVLLLLVYANIYFLNKQIFRKSLLFLFIPFSYYYFFWFLKFNIIETYINKILVFDEHSDIERKTFLEFILNSFKDLNKIFLLTLFVGLLLRIYHISKLTYKSIIINKDFIIISIALILVLINFKIFSYDNRNFFIIHSLLIYLSSNGIYDLITNSNIKIDKYLNQSLNIELKFFHPTISSIIFAIIFLFSVLIYSNSSINYKFSNKKLTNLHKEQLLKLGDKKLNLFILENYNQIYEYIVTDYDYLFHIPGINPQVDLCRKKGCNQYLEKAFKQETLFIFKEKNFPKIFKDMNLIKIDKFNDFIFYSK